MDKRREELEEQKADLHLALLMDEYAERMGKQVREEAEAAFERGELEMPPELDAKCRALISDAPAVESKKTMKAAARYALVATLTIVLLFGTLIAVQAAGIDVFGSIATWTDSVFHFGNKSEPVAEEPTVPSNSMQDALRDNGMPLELAPNELPEGYIISDVTVLNTGMDKIVSIYAEKSDDNPLIIAICEHASDTNIQNYQMEKDNHPVDIFTWNGKSFYLFTNEESWVAVWSDNKYTIEIYGAQSKQQLYEIIKSIGDTTYD